MYRCTNEKCTIIGTLVYRYIGKLKRTLFYHKTIYNDLKFYIFVQNKQTTDHMMSVHLDDRKIREKFKHSFKQFFKPLCFQAMTFVKDEDVAKDIVHDVFLTVWSRRAQVDFSQPLYPYYLSLTRNRSLNYLDHLRVKKCYEEKELHASPLYISPEDSGHEELILKIIQRIDALPERCREVMRLCFIDCKKYKEIAELLGISVNTVKTHLAQGIKILRQEFPSSLLFIFFYRFRRHLN